MFVFPAANERALTETLCRLAAERGIALLPAYRLEDLLANLGVTITRTWLAEPFRGLEPFEFAHASIFFGRGPEIAQLLDLLARRPAVLVCGPSGAGKSSLVLAGVLPALLRRESNAGGVRWGLLRPRDIVVDADQSREQGALAQAFAAAWGHNEEGGLGATAKDGSAPPLAAPAFMAWLGELGATRPVLVVDQLEELFDSRLHPATAEAFADFLAELARAGVKVLATITKAAIADLSQRQKLAACFGLEGQFVLEPRHDATLLDAAIRAPAAAAGLRFEPGLEAELVASASHGGADILPLLELLLTELYERRDLATRELRWSDYREVGGLDGVVSARAEAVYRDLPPPEREMVAHLLWKLGTAGVVQAQDYPKAHPLHAVLAAYQRRRLLVRDGGEGGARLRAAHDALLRHWSRAQEQLRSDGADIGLWRDLRREAAQWKARNRALLPSGPQLSAALSLHRRRGKDWTASDVDLIDYVLASARQRDRRRLVAGLVMSLPIAAAGAFGFIKIKEYVDAQRVTRIAFDDAVIPPGDNKTSAAQILDHYGISTDALVPEPSELLVMRVPREAGRSVGFFPRARPEEASATARPQWRTLLLQIASARADSMSFRLIFSRAASAFKALSISGSEASEMGLALPADWDLVPLDSNHSEMALSDYRSFRLDESEDKFWHNVEARSDHLIHGVKVSTYFHQQGPSADPASHAANEDFEGVHGIPIQELQIVR